MKIRRLGPGDNLILERLALDDPLFDLDGRGEPLTPLTKEKADAYLADPAVLHWIASDGDTVVGFLYCLHMPLRSDHGHELLLYEVGVRVSWRRKGVGRALNAEMEKWMRDHDVREVWLGADNRDAVEFYKALGFGAEPTEESNLPAHHGSIFMDKEI